jgi:hypothetical protein
MPPVVFDAEVPASAEILTRREERMTPQKIFQTFLLWAERGGMTIDVVNTKP